MQAWERREGKFWVHPLRGTSEWPYLPTTLKGTRWADVEQCGNDRKWPQNTYFLGNAKFWKKNTSVRLALRLASSSKCVETWVFYVLISPHWLLSLSGPPHSLKCSEVRKDSLVLQWKPPVHSGRTPVTGYFVDVKEAKAKEDQWRGLNEAAIKNVYLKVRGCSVLELPWKKKGGGNCSTNINLKVSKIKQNISALICFIYWAPGKIPLAEVGAGRSFWCLQQFGYI